MLPRPKKRLGSARRASGFTLTELLVVIVIIAILVALLLGVWPRAKLSADMARTVRNLGALQRANVVYAAEHDGCYVPVRTFNEQGSSYVGWLTNPEFLSYLRGCTVEQARLSSEVPKGSLDPCAVQAHPEYLTLQGSYGYNCEGIPNTGTWGSPNSTSYFRATQLTAPSRTMSFITATDWQAKYSGRFLWAGTKAVEGRTPDGKIAYRYGKKAVVAYFDGHVGSVTMSDMERIDVEGNGIDNIFWNGDATKPQSLK